MSEAESKGPGVDAGLKRHGGLSYLEIPAADVERSGRFYRDVMGWQVRDGDGGKFADAAGLLIGRFVTERPAARKGGMLAFFYVIGIRETVERAVANDGEIVKPVYREGDLWVAVMRDPGGNLVGVWEEG